MLDHWDALLAGNAPLAAAIGLLLGAIAGSFTATILVRWPRGRSVVAGRSRCDGCGARLRAAELVPVLSYLAARGRCRRCGGRIDARHIGVELGSAALGGIAMLAHPGVLGLVTALLGWWLLLLALLDLEHQWLPDLLTGPLVPLGLLAGWAGWGPPLDERLAGALFGFLALAGIAFFYRRLRGREGLGGGDPKLFAAIGAWVGGLQLPFVLLAAALLGLVAALLMRMLGKEVTALTRLPFGTFLALAAWPVWLLIAP